MAASLLFSGSITVTTSPTGRLSPFSHRTIRTTTRSLSFAPLRLLNGIKRSGIGFSVSVTKKAKSLFSCMWPINSVRFRSSTSITSPCIRRPKPLLIFIRTVSPCIAVLKSEGRINTSVSCSGTMTKPIPERVISSLPLRVLPEEEWSFCFFLDESLLPIT